MGFDFMRGRLDHSSHPFTLAAGAHDVRLTVRYDEGNLASALYAALHEGGHGLYDQGFGADLERSLLADAPSIGVHESQSRLWENQVGRSAAFWRGFFPVAQRTLGSALDGLDADAMYRAVNRVAPGLDRVGADELTYNLHIVMRTELELALLGGHLQPADLPEVWREKSLRYFGIAPPNDVVGCLQDVHWALGSFGYFPSYTIGNLYAAMLWEQLRRDLPNVDDALARGDLAPVTDWLRREVHAHGARETAGAMIVRITGQPLSAASFLGYVEAKFGTS
jgi:carboxypeptidase Taq